MWQRKQTLFLLLSAVLVGLLYCIPSFNIEAITTAGNATAPAAQASLSAITYRVTALGINPADNYAHLSLLPLLLTGIILLLTLVDLFLFKKRKIQARVAVFTILLVVALVGVILFETFTFGEQEGRQIYMSWGLILYPLAILFYYLAIRGIVADEILVRSVNRLRD